MVNGVYTRLPDRSFRCTVNSCHSETRRETFVFRTDFTLPTFTLVPYRRVRVGFGLMCLRSDTEVDFVSSYVSGSTGYVGTPGSLEFQDGGSANVLICTLMVP